MPREKKKDDKIRVWRAYNIGSGKLIKLKYPSSSELPNLTATETDVSAFTSMKPRRTNVPEQVSSDQVDRNNATESNLTVSKEAVFACPEECCTQTFLRQSLMQRHLDCGKHDRALERNILIDRAATAYAERLEGQTTSVPEIMSNTPPDSSLEKLPMGWALKSSTGRRSQFTSTQKTYLTAKFKLQEESGKKAHPASVTQAMETACLQAMIFLLQVKLPASFPVFLQKRPFKTRKSLKMTSRVLRMKRDLNSLQTWLCMI